MPIYSYDCPACDNKEELIADYEKRNEQKCSNCGEPTGLQVCTPKVVNFRAGWYEHVAPEPVYCETPQDLQEACNRNGGISEYLENSNFKVRRDYDEYEEKRERTRERNLTAGGEP